MTDNEEISDLWPRPKDDLIGRLTKACKVADACPECLLDREQAAAALREQEAEIARLKDERVDWTRRFALNDVTPWEWMTRAERAEAECIALREMLTDHEKLWREQYAEQAAEIERLQAEIARLRDLDHYNTHIIARSVEKLKQAEIERDTIRKINNGRAAECEALTEERDALRQLLLEARDYVDAEVKYKEAAHGDRIQYKRAGDIDLRARIDAAMKEKPNV